jgi:alkyl hydroperoxide reductase subunit AhpF
VLQLVVAVAVVVVAVLVGLILRRRQVVAAPTQPRFDVPAQLDRTDFAADTPWLVAVFSSATCTSCADVVRKAKVLQSPEVTVVEVEFGTAKQLHEKYDIQAVPIVAIADAQGVVRAGFAGPVTATDLWAAVAEAREPGASPEPDLGR